MTDKIDPAAVTAVTAAAPKTPTPCIGVCSTGLGDSVCRGCKRFAHEVVSWNAYSDREKDLIEERLQEFLRAIIADKLQVEDEALLRLRLRQSGTRHLPSRDALCLLADLLRAAAASISDPAQFGFSVRPAWRHLPLGEVRRTIDREFYLRSCAYYERRIGPLQEMSSPP